MGSGRAGRERGAAALGRLSRSGLRRLPRWVQLLVGAGCVVAGLVLVARPFTSLSVLVYLVAAAALVTGAVRWTTARGTANLLDGLVVIGWVVLGIAVVAWPDLSVRGLAVFVGVAMVVGGGADLVGGFRGTVDERAAAALKGAASVVLGLVALSWPDVTLLVVAVVFGARTVLFGVSALVAAVRGPGAPGDEGPPRPTGRRRRSVHLVGTAVALVVALVLGGVSIAIHKGEPRLDDFYDAPAAVPAEPGVLLRAEAFTRDVPDGATGWRILYTTTRDDGVDALASALVVAPGEPSTEPHPVIAWAHGTTGVSRRCAPSVLDDPFGSGAFYALDRVLAEGWVLVATDYVGLGTEGGHPYMVGHSAGRSVLDAVRAARQLDDVRLADDTVVWGHSQGGGAALWTGQVAQSYAPELDVRGVAALAPAADTVNLADNLRTTTGGSIFAAYILAGYATAYPDVRVDDYVRFSARTVVRGLADRCLSEPAMLVSVLASISTSMSVFSTDLDAGALGARLAENVPEGPFGMPLLIGQGGADSLIVPGVQARYADRLCTAGADVDYRAYPGRDHVGLVAADSPLLPDLVAWTQQRLEGRPSTPTCR